MNNMKYTRDQYMNKEVTHAEYYGQFVTPEIKTMVLNGIGLDRLLRSTDEHLNDIPLNNWDCLAGSSKFARMQGNYACTLHVENNSLASAVCTLKQAAKMIISENK